MVKSGNRIITKIARPSKELIESFRGVPVANVDDCMGRLAAFDPDIIGLNKIPIVGTAFTVRVPRGDNLMLHKAMDLAEPGDVLVIDAGGGDERAIFGGLMVSYCHKRGLAGMIVDGYVRDMEEITLLDFPVYARGYSPNGPYKNGPGEINVPVVIGGKVVHPGDIIIGDGDGILAVPPDEADEILKATKALQSVEEGLMQKIIEQGSYIRPWVDDKLKSIGCTIE